MITGWSILSLTGSLIALFLSAVTLTIHYIRKREEPDIHEIWTHLKALRTDHLDLLDKVEHWRKRDNVRRARQGREKQIEQQAEQEYPESRQERKAALRRRAAGAVRLPFAQHGEES